MKKISIKRVLILLFIVLAVLILPALAINLYIVRSTENHIISFDAAKEKKADCIIILGAGVSENSGALSYVLRDRLDTGIALYHEGRTKKILMTGDHGRQNYDEVNAMKRYAVSKGVLPEDIFMDHAGFSTYESMFRARKIFQVESAIIVTQRYHLHRALFLAKSFGINVVGVSADNPDYDSGALFYLREELARVKDFFFAIFKPKPKFLGEPIPITGDGNITND